MTVSKVISLLSAGGHCRFLDPNDREIGSPLGDGRIVATLLCSWWARVSRDNVAGQASGLALFSLAKHDGNLKLASPDSLQANEVFSGR